MNIEVEESQSNLSSSMNTTTMNVIFSG